MTETTSAIRPADRSESVERLAAGIDVRVRPIRPGDAPLEREFLESLSPEAKRYRFLGQIGHPSDAFIERLTDIDPAREAAFIALVDREGAKHAIGVARFSAASDGASCECAVTVLDAWQRRGLATLLMWRLIDVARERGIRSMISYDAADNVAMRELAADLGFTRNAHPDDAHLVVHRLTL